MATMDQEQKKALLAVLNDRWKDQICEVCKNKHWSISEHIITPIIMDGGDLQIGGPSYPQAMTICLTCGNTKYFNLVVTGIIKNPALALPPVEAPIEDGDDAT